MRGERLQSATLNRDTTEVFNNFALIRVEYDSTLSDDKMCFDPQTQNLEKLEQKIWNLEETDFTGPFVLWTSAISLSQCHKDSLIPAE